MEISDELRRWCDGADMDSDACDLLRKLADRIDREMVELPKDADGVPIHVGDTVWDVSDDMEFVVGSITLYAGGAAKVNALCRGCDAHTSPKYFTHNRPDSWERIADDIESYYKAHAFIIKSTLDEFADRIRKLAKKEGK